MAPTPVEALPGEPAVSTPVEALAANGETRVDEGPPMEVISLLEAVYPTRGDGKDGGRGNTLLGTARDDSVTMDCSLLGWMLLPGKDLEPSGAISLARDIRLLTLRLAPPPLGMDFSGDVLRCRGRSR